MANDAGRAAILQDKMIEAGVPVVGITVTDINATPVAFTVQYDAAITSEQQALGDQMAGDFDWRKRRALARATVVSSLGALTVGQRAAIDAHMRAEFLRQSPTLAAKIGLATETPIVVDEVDPT